jgi:F-box/WD-40 domain protein 9
MELEEAVNFWGSQEVMKKNLYCLASHHVCVDCVCLLTGRGKHLCLSGGRDRAVVLWDLDKLCQKENTRGNYQALIESRYVHKGWVWCFASHWPEMSDVCSGGWDGHVTTCDVEQGLEIKSHIKIGAAVLSLARPEPEVLIAGAYDKHIRHYDLRAPSSPISSVKSHQKAVLCLKASDNFVISGSDDRTVVLWDRRTNKEYKKIEGPSSVLSLHFGCDKLLVGFSNGSLSTYVGDDFRLVEVSCDY